MPALIRHSRTNVSSRIPGAHSNQIGRIPPGHSTHWTDLHKSVYSSATKKFIARIKLLLPLVCIFCLQIFLFFFFISIHRGNFFFLNRVHNKCKKVPEINSRGPFIIFFTVALFTPLDNPDRHF